MYRNREKKNHYLLKWKHKYILLDVICSITALIINASAQSIFFALRLMYNIIKYDMYAIENVVNKVSPR